MHGNIYQVVDDADDLAAGAVLLFNGRRYKVSAAQVNSAGEEGGITLSETFAGSQYLEICSSCVDEVTAGTDMEAAISISKDWGYGADIFAGEQVMLGGSTTFDGLLAHQLGE